VDPAATDNHSWRLHCHKLTHMKYSCMCVGVYLGGCVFGWVTLGVSVGVRVRVCVCVCLCVWVCVGVGACVHVCECLFVGASGAGCVCLCVCVCAGVHVRVSACVCVRLACVAMCGQGVGPLLSQFWWLRHLSGVVLSPVPGGAFFPLLESLPL